MLRNTIYYRIKPFVPKFVRMAVRRRMALRARRRVSGVWPISPGSEKKPAGWSGWPHGKQFAFVLTHDVEGPAGMGNVPALFDLIRGMGFRSSFNLIPEGDYHVPADVRAELTRHGFEVGVHDLEHDGRLYQSKTRFLRNAARINQYLHDWQASGFRSGFMLHNLDWLHELDITYDASTFDTDPFEPQPEGTHTIFPFWLPRPADPDAGPSARTGYVELSYTLPQDSTVFLLLGEQTAQTWIDKLDWVAAQGGMALVNIHPDYIDFSGGGKCARGKYPVARVRELLEHVATKYADRCWNPCARELAGWFVTSGSTPAIETKTGQAPVPLVPTILRGKRAAVLLYSHYPADPRPRRAAEALVEAGVEVDLICLRENDDEPASETVGGVSVRRIPLRRQRGRKLSYLFLYSRFILRCFFHLAWHGWRKKYDLIHVHNMPDVLVFSTLVPKLFGAKIVLDLHDPMPELMTSIYELDRNHWLVRTLRWLERWSIAMSDLAITPNVTFKNLFVSRSCRAGKMRIVMNSPEQQIFDPDRPDLAGADRREGDGEFRLMHHGSIVHRHGIDLLVEAVAQIYPKLPGVRLDIYGSPTPFLEVVLETGRRLGVEHLIRYHGAKTQAEIAEAIRHCHLGVVPNRRSAFTDINLPTRLFEYLAMHRPVIAPSTQGIRDYFAPDELFMFDRDDVGGLAKKILRVASHPQEARECVERGVRVYRRHLWEREKAGFLGYVAALVRTRRTSTPASVNAVRNNLQPAAERNPV